LFIFRVREEILHSPDTGEYKAFGVEAFDKTDEKLVAFVSDVFLCEDEASAFVNRLNECQPELVHLTELCIDAIQ